MIAKREKDPPRCRVVLMSRRADCGSGELGRANINAIILYLRAYKPIVTNVASLQRATRSLRGAAAADVPPACLRLIGELPAQVAPSAHINTSLRCARRRVALSAVSQQDATRLMSRLIRSLSCSFLFARLSLAPFCVHSHLCLCRSSQSNWPSSFISVAIN